MALLSKPVTAHDTNQPRWIVCEDGHEYTERFERFLTGFSFHRAGSALDLFELLNRSRVDGILLDLDFRRTPTGKLIDDTGNFLANRPPDETKRLLRDALSNHRLGAWQPCLAHSNSGPSGRY